jgi:hypothetical protein
MSSCASDSKTDSLSCKPPADAPPSEGLEGVVVKYRRSCQSRLDAQLRSFADEPTLQSAVARAALAETRDGKRYSHQRRLKRVVLQAVRSQLFELDFGAIRGFDELHTIIDRAIGSIHGVGELMVYDTALRIGAKLRVMPDRVYLHSGTRRGARSLGLPFKMRSISIAELPGPLRSLKPYEIENCLCIFKDLLQASIP